MQVYAIIIEWMSQLDEVDRRKIKWILYDDMCHLGKGWLSELDFGINVTLILGPYSQRGEILNHNDLTKFFGTRNLAVDCLHFLNHRDKVCKGCF